MLGNENHCCQIFLGDSPKIHITNRIPHQYLTAILLLWNITMDFFFFKPAFGTKSHYFGNPFALHASVSKCLNSADAIRPNVCRHWGTSMSYKRKPLKEKYSVLVSFIYNALSRAHSNATIGWVHYFSYTLLAEYSISGRLLWILNLSFKTGLLLSSQSIYIHIKHSSVQQFRH